MGFARFLRYNVRMKTFFSEHHDLPDGIGYPLWGKIHIISLLVVLACVVLLLALFHRLDAKKQNRILHVLPYAMLALELAKDSLLISLGRFTVGYAPLHLCSLGVFVFLFYDLAKSEKWRGIWGEIAYTLILPGALLALVDPDWTYRYPVLNFFNLFGYTWHTLLVLFPAFLMIGKQIHPTIRHLHYDLIFLCAVVPPVMLYDKLTDTNFMFLNFPIPQSPLSWLASFLGVPGYLVGYAALIFLMLLIVYFLIWAVGRILRAVSRPSCSLDVSEMER